MAWALIGPRAAWPLLEADLELGPLGQLGCQLAVAGRYYVPGRGANGGIDHGIAQRVGESTIKEFVDGLATAVDCRAARTTGQDRPEQGVVNNADQHLNAGGHHRLNQKPATLRRPTTEQALAPHFRETGRRAPT